MKIAIIAALGKFRVIGNVNKLPWHLPADLKYFKKITLGKPIIMGRKTYESIGKPLPERQNIVITSNKDFKADGIQVVHSFNEAMALAQESDEAMVIGGAEIFKQALPHAQRLYLTFVHHEFPGDTFFPDINTEEWQEISREMNPPDEKNPYPHSFVVYER